MQMTFLKGWTRILIPQRPEQCGDAARALGYPALGGYIARSLDDSIIPKLLSPQLVFGET